MRPSLHGGCCVRGARYRRSWAHKPQMQPSLHGGCCVRGARYRRSLAHKAPQAMAPVPKNRAGAQKRPIPGLRPTPGLPQAAGKNGQQGAPCATAAKSLTPKAPFPHPRRHARHGEPCGACAVPADPEATGGRARQGQAFRVARIAWRRGAPWAGRDKVLLRQRGSAAQCARGAAAREAWRQISPMAASHGAAGAPRRQAKGAAGRPGTLCCR